MANLDNAGLSRFRRWYDQYRATHGTTPPRNMVSTFLEGEMEASMARSERSQELALRKQALNTQSEIEERRLGLLEEQTKNADKAATVSGIGNIAALGLGLQKETGLFTKAAPVVKGAAKSIGNWVSGTGTPSVAAPAATGTAATMAGENLVAGGIGETGTNVAGYAGENLVAGGTAPATSVTSGITSGVGTAVPYYGLTKLGGSIGTGLASEGTYVHQVGESLNRPFNVERYFTHNVLDTDEDILNYSFDLLNPLGFGEREISEEIGTVLCTELYRQGKLEHNIYAADSAYGRTLDPEVLAGYHTWAVPLAGLMAKSKVVTAILEPFIRAWAQEMAYRMKAVDKGSLLGKCLERAGVPICRLIGKISWEVKHGYSC